MRGRVGRRKCQTSAGSKSFAVENEGRECAFSALRQRSGVPQAEARKKSHQGFSRPPPCRSRPEEGSDPPTDPDLEGGPGPRRGDPDLEGATVGEPSGAASGGLVAHSRCHVPGGLSAARWHTHGARGSRLCTTRITPDHATPRPVCPQAMPEAVRVFRPVALAPGGLGSRRYQAWCDMRVQEGRLLAPLRDEGAQEEAGPQAQSQSG